MKSMNEQPVVSMVVRMPSPERLFLWATRAWAASHTDLTAVWWSLDRAFSQEGMSGALPPFHQLMSTLFSGLKRWPDIRCVACPHLGRDEARLLRVLSHLQQGNEVGARALMGELVMRSSIRVACRHAVDCVAIVSAAGRQFTGPASNSPAVSACADRGRNVSAADAGSMHHEPVVH